MNYRCKWCNSEFELTKNQIKMLNKEPSKLFFCCRSCSGRYYAIKSHNRTPEQEQERREKISKTLRAKENNLTEEQKRKRIENWNKYWKDLTPEQRSERNKKNGIKAKQTKQERYGDPNYNNREKAKQTMVLKCGFESLDNSNNEDQLAIDEKSIFICSYCGKEFNPSSYQKRQFALRKNIFCKTSCATAFRYGKNFVELPDKELAKEIKYYLDNTELNYDQIIHKLRSFV